MYDKTRFKFHMQKFTHFQIPQAHIRLISFCFLFSFASWVFEHREPPHGTLQAYNLWFMGLNKSSLCARVANLYDSAVSQNEQFNKTHARIMLRMLSSTEKGKSNHDYRKDLLVSLLVRAWVSMKCLINQHRHNNLWNWISRASLYSWAFPLCYFYWGRSFMSSMIQE